MVVVGGGLAGLMTTIKLAEAGQNREILALTGEETYSIEGIAADFVPGKKLSVRVRSGASEKKFSAIARIDTPVELAYYRHGGILQYMLRQLAK